MSVPDGLITEEGLALIQDGGIIEGMMNVTPGGWNLERDDEWLEFKNGRGFSD